MRFPPASFRTSKGLRLHLCHGPGSSPEGYLDLVPSVYARLPRTRRSQRCFSKLGSHIPSSQILAPFAPDIVTGITPRILFISVVLPLPSTGSDFKNISEYPTSHFFDIIFFHLGFTFSFCGFPDSFNLVRLLDREQIGPVAGLRVGKRDSWSPSIPSTMGGSPMMDSSEAVTGFDIPDFRVILLHVLPAFPE